MATSDRIVLQVPADLKERLVTLTSEQGRTVTYVGTQLLKGWLDGKYVLPADEATARDKSRQGRKRT